MDERPTIREILLALYRYQARGWRGSSIPIAAKDARDSLLGSGFVPVGEKELEAITKDLLVGRGRHQRYRRIGMFLPPLPRDTGFVPVLWVSEDYKRFRLELFTIDNGRVFSLGIRFEYPEGEGMHDYYHCQLFNRSQEYEENRFLNCPAWLPDTIPCLPLPAKNGVELLLCIYWSLYGREEVIEFIRSVNILPAFSSAIGPFIYEL